MTLLYKFIILVLVNFAGFFAMPFAFHFARITGIIGQNAPTDVNAFTHNFINGTYWTWAVCALFSFSYLFLQGKERLIFLAAPVVIPVCYGLYTLVRIFSA